MVRDTAIPQPAITASDSTAGDSTADKQFTYKERDDDEVPTALQLKEYNGEDDLRVTAPQEQGGRRMTRLRAHVAPHERSRILAGN